MKHAKVTQMRFRIKLGVPQIFYLQGTDLENVTDVQLREKNPRFLWTQDDVVLIDDSLIQLTFTASRVKVADHKPRVRRMTAGDGDGTTTIYIQNGGSPDYEPVNPPIDTTYTD